MAKKLVPLLDRILVEKIVPSTKSVGGVLLPESASSKVNSGKVVATGSGGRTKDGSLIPLTVKEGDTVLLPEFGGTEVKIGGKELHIYRNDDVLGILVY
ncbi:hypothetical protein L7F22_026174 [Adiantum nelumboides]|nr:hypothetical protein [Adiantum nelumboides]